MYGRMAVRELLAKEEEHKEIPQVHSRMEFKTKEQRLKEGLTILQKLRKIEIPQANFGIQTIQKRISQWVSTGEPLKEIIPIPNYDRDAHLTLPVERNRTAELVLRQIPQ
jgi:hypothetical protein